MEIPPKRPTGMRVSIDLPSDAKPGDEYEFEVEGHTYKIIVPRNEVPKQISIPVGLKSFRKIWTFDPDSDADLLLWKLIIEQSCLDMNTKMNVISTCKTFGQIKKVVSRLHHLYKVDDDDAASVDSSHVWALAEGTMIKWCSNLSLLSLANVQLIQAASLGDLPTIKACISEIDEREVSRLLVKATHNSRISLVDYLLDSRPLERLRLDTDGKWKEGNDLVALFLRQVSRNNLDVVKLLVHKYGKETLHFSEYTALAQAAYCGSNDVIPYLIEIYDNKEDSSSCITQFSRECCEDNDSDEDLWNEPFVWALRQNRVDTAKMLVDRCTLSYTTGHDSLLWRVVSDNSILEEKTLQYIFSIGVDPNTMDLGISDMPCIKLAFFESYSFSILKCFIDAGADVNAKESDDESLTILEYLCETDNPSDEVRAMIRLVIEAGATPPDVIDHEGIYCPMIERMCDERTGSRVYKDGNHTKTVFDSSSKFAKQVWVFEEGMHVRTEYEEGHPLHTCVLYYNEDATSKLVFGEKHHKYMCTAHFDEHDVLTRVETQFNCKKVMITEYSNGAKGCALRSNTCCTCSKCNSQHMWRQGVERTYLKDEGVVFYDWNNNKWKPWNESATSLQLGDAIRNNFRSLFAILLNEHF